MWKSAFIQETNQRMLSVSPGGATMDMSSVFSRKPNPAPSSTIRRKLHRSTSVKAVSGKNGLYAADPSQWTEHAVYELLSKPLKTPPPLDTILEMKLRVHGGHKFLCKFLNAAGMECVVWVRSMHLLKVEQPHDEGWEQEGDREGARELWEDIVDKEGANQGITY